MTEGVAPASTSAFGPGTLARKLLLRVLALVAAAAVLLSLLTTLAVRELLVGQVDQQLNAAIDRVRRDRYDGPGGSDGPDGRGPSGGLLEPGQPIGTLYAAYRTDQGQQGEQHLQHDELRQQPIDLGQRQSHHQRAVLRGAVLADRGRVRDQPVATDTVEVD